MRILRVSQKMYPDVIGGGPYHVSALSRDQAEMGHDVTLVTVRHDDSAPQVEQRDGYTVVRFDSLCSPLGNEISPGVARYLWNAEAFDVIHAHSHLYFSSNLAAIKRRLSGTPLAITNHGLYSQSSSKRIFDLYLRTVGRWTFNQADLIFCYTEIDKQRVQELGVSSQIDVIQNGIDTDRFTPEGSKSELVTSSGPVVLFVGRLVEGKRPETALESFAKVHEERPDATAYFCGDGPLREELQQRAIELGIRNHVTFLGDVSYEEMPAVYRSADVLVLPSRSEGVPRTIMEALASGIPVVGADLKQVRAAFGQSILYSTRETASGYQEQICTALESDQTAELGDDKEWRQTVQETTRALQALADEDVRSER